MIKKAESFHIDYIKKIEVECGLSPWNRDDYLKETERSDSLFFIFEQNFEVIGFILARLIMLQSQLPHDNEAEIYNIAVGDNFRKSRIGSELLTRVIKSAAEKNVSRIYLEVRKSNTAAIKFYQKNAFEIIGERRNFYSNPPEDAVLMCRIISYTKNV